MSHDSLIWKYLDRLAHCFGFCCVISSTLHRLVRKVFFYDYRRARSLVVIALDIPYNYKLYRKVRNFRGTFAGIIIASFCSNFWIDDQARKNGCGRLSD